MTVEPTDAQIRRYVEIQLEMDDPHMKAVLNRWHGLTFEQYELGKAMGSPTYSVDDIKELHAQEWEIAEERLPWTWPKHGAPIEYQDSDGQVTKGSMRILLRPDRIIRFFDPEDKDAEATDIGFPFRWRHARRPQADQP